MRSEEQLIQERLLADSELQEFDIVDKIGKGIGRVAGSAAKAAGAVAGGVAGLGQAAKAGYQAGKATVGAGGADPDAAGGTSATPAPAAKPAAGGTSATPAPAAKPAAGGTQPKSGIAQGVDQAEKPEKYKKQPFIGSGSSSYVGPNKQGVLSKVAGAAGAALDKTGRAIGHLGATAQKARDYNPAKGTELGAHIGSEREKAAAQDAKTKADAAAIAGAAAQGQQGAAQPAAGAAQPAVTSTGGSAPGATQVPGQKPATSTAPGATQVPGQKAAGAAPGSIVKSASGKDVIAGVDGKPTAIPANSPGAKKAIADIQAKAKEQGTTTTLINTPKGQDPEASPTDKGGPSDTAQGVGDKTGVTPPDSQAKPGAKPDIKVGGQKIKSTDPLYDKLVASIPAETRAQIDGLSDYDKGRLKKELAA